MSVRAGDERLGPSTVRVAQVWRYPVKSMQGETVAALDLEPDLHVPGDREWCVRDSQTGEVLNARATRVLLQASATLDDADGTVTITFPDGRVMHEDDPALDLALSSLVGRPVHLAHAKDDEVVTIAAPQDFEDDRSRLTRWRSHPGTFNDGHLLHLLTTASLRAGAALHPAGTWDARRFRPNLVIDVAGDEAEFVEDAWTNVRVGAVELEIYKRTTRCVITARAQPGIPDDLGVTRALARNRSAKLGVYARVTSPGTIAAGALVHPT